MAAREEAVKILRSSKTSKRKPHTISLSADDSDPDINIESSSEAVASKRRRGRGISPSKALTHCVNKPSIKVTRSTKTGVQAAVSAQLDEPEEPEEVRYWQRRRPLNISTPHEEPTAKQVVDAAGDWSRAQRDSRFPEFKLYDLVIQDPTEDDVITRLSEEPYQRMGDLQFLLQTRYEDPIDEARDFHKALFVFRYDTPPDKEQNCPHSAAVRDGQIRVARVWALSEVMERQGAREKCWVDEAMLLKLVMGQAEMSKVSLEQWKEVMELRQLRPYYPNPKTIEWQHSQASHRPNIAVAAAGSRSGGKCAATRSVLGADRPAPIGLDIIENDVRPLAKKVQPKSGMSLLVVKNQPISANPASRTSATSDPAISARPASLMRPPPRPLGAVDTTPASNKASAPLRSTSANTSIEAEVARIALNFCTKKNEEVQLHFVQCTKYIVNTVQHAIWQFVSTTVPASESYTQEQWQQVLKNHLHFQQKRFERKWCEGHPGNTFRPNSQNILARQLSCYLVDYATRYPCAQSVPEAQAHGNRSALQRAAMRKQQGLLASWTKYWEVAVQMRRCNMGDGENNRVQQQPVTPRPVQSIPGSQIGLSLTKDDEALAPDVLRKKRKRADDGGLPGLQQPHLTKRARSTDNGGSTMDPRLRAMAI